MIIDKITNLSKYRSLIPHIESIVRYLGTIDTSKMTAGKYDLPGTDLFHYCFEYDSAAFDSCKGEAHQKYIDIHMIVQGTETVGALDGTADEIGQYDPPNDHAPASGSFRKCILAKGDFVMFFQHEGHITSAHAIPGISDRVKRLVFKVPIRLESSV